jgi:5-methylcytosine-specific restriction enzyme A
MGWIRTQAPRIATRDTRAVKQLPKQVDGFYLSTEWRNLVASLTAERGRRCEQCGRTGEGGERVRIFGDHVRELRDGGALFDPLNVKLLCGACHATKTLAERGKRMAERPAPVIA